MVYKERDSVAWEYFYDSENRLVEVDRNFQTKAKYVYDGDGGRTKKTVYYTCPLARMDESGSKTKIAFWMISDFFVNDAEAAVLPAEQGPFEGGGGIPPKTTVFVGSLYEVTSSRPAQHIYLGDARIASIREGQVLYNHGNHLGSTNIVTDEIGELKELIEYLPYGTFSRHEKYGSNSETALFYFTGKQLDTETGLYYYGARYYDPLIGRFITADTIVQNPGGNPQTLNRYAYCGNNPVNNIDPTGHSWWKTIVSAVAGIAAFVGSGFNPIIGFQAFSMVNAGLNLGDALVTGEGIGQAFGTFAASFALSAGFGAVGWHDITNIGMRVGAFAAEGATIGVAGAAINDGDLGQGAYMGAGVGATMGFMSSEQFSNWRGGEGFNTHKQISARNRRVANMAGQLGAKDSGTVQIGRHGVHTGLDIKSSTLNRVIGKYPLAAEDATGSTRSLQYIFGKKVTGDFSNFMELDSRIMHQTLRTYAINGVQEAMLHNYINNGPGSFALTTNCTDWAVGALRSIGHYVPRSNYTSFGFADPNQLFNEN